MTAPTLSIEHPPWMRAARCVGSDPDIFYPGWGNSHLVIYAKRICAQCPVTTECLTYALDHNELNHGVWGGLSVMERRRLARSQRRRSA